MDKPIEQLVQLVRDAAPALWEAASAKVQADIGIAVIGIVAGLVMAVLSAYITWLMLKKVMVSNSLDLDGPLLCSVGAFVTAVVIIIMCGIEYYMLTHATQWYVLEAIVELSPIK